MTADHGGTTLRLREDYLTWRDAGEELVIFNSQNGKYLTLNASAKGLWAKLAVGTTEVELAQGLSAQHDISTERAIADIELFLGNLRDRQMLVEG